MLLLAAAMAASCASAPTTAAPERQRPLRVLLLPPENLTGGSASTRELAGAVERALAKRGVDVVTGEPLDDFMARHRMRYTGGLDRTLARAAREELGVDGVLVTSVGVQSLDPPALALTLRLVATTDDATILWMDGRGRTFDDSPGLFATGIVTSYDELQAGVVASLADSLAAFATGEGPSAPRCSTRAVYRPRVAYRDEPITGNRSVLVLPFVNNTKRRSAGEVVANEFTRQLVAGDFRVLEPGIVRDQLLRFRVVMESGVSVDQARLMMDSLEADLVATGYVYGYSDRIGVPSANVTIMVLERRTGQVVWQSTSFNKGTDSMTFFGLGRVFTGPTLSCAMVRNVVDTLEGRIAMPPKP